MSGYVLCVTHATQLCMLKLPTQQFARVLDVVEPFVQCVSCHSAPSRTCSEFRADPRWPAHRTQVHPIVMALVCGHSFARRCPNVTHRESRSVQTAFRMSPFANIRHSPVLQLDLNDVHTLQTNLFGFLHHVVQGLRKKGVRRIPFPPRSLTYML
jgi:hypothetical protein